MKNLTRLALILSLAGVTLGVPVHAATPTPKPSPKAVVKTPAAKTPAAKTPAAKAAKTPAKTPGKAAKTPASKK